MTGGAKQPLGVFSAWPDGLKAMLAVDHACEQEGLPTRLLELVRLWCSVLNACAFCIAMHEKKALSVGVSSELIADLIARQDISALTKTEQVAIGLGTAMTRLDYHAAMAEARTALEAHFNRHQIIILTYAIAQINAWNRVARMDEASEMLTPGVRYSAV